MGCADSAARIRLITPAPSYIVLVVWIKGMNIRIKAIDRIKRCGELGFELCRNTPLFKGIKRTLGI
jgi:hypothetical protein